MAALSSNTTFNESCDPDDHHDIRHDVLHGFHLVGHFGAGGSLLVIELITNEIFPTVARWVRLAVGSFDGWVDWFTVWLIAWFTVWLVAWFTVWLVA